MINDTQLQLFQLCAKIRYTLIRIDWKLLMFLFNWRLLHCKVAKFCVFLLSDNLCPLFLLLLSVPPLPPFLWETTKRNKMRRDETRWLFVIAHWGGWSCVNICCVARWQSSASFCWVTTCAFFLFFFFLCLPCLRICEKPPKGTKCNRMKPDGCLWLLTGAVGVVIVGLSTASVTPNLSPTNGHGSELYGSGVIPSSPKLPKGMKWSSEKRGDIPLSPNSPNGTK